VGGYQPSPEEREKNRLKSSLAAAAPALIPLVMIVSTNSVTMLKVASLDRIGLLAAVVVIIALSYLLFRRRWWAGLPAMTAYIILFGLFAVKTIRPLYAYFSVNSFNSPEGGLTPLMMISPAAVIMLMSFVLGRMTLRGISMAIKDKPIAVSRAAWGILVIWAALLVGDAAYHEAGWRYVKNPDDVVLKLCAGNKAEQLLAEKILLDLGPRAMPALRKAMAVEDPGLECLRERSEAIFHRISVQAQAQS
jgi:hypothetical protein